MTTYSRTERLAAIQQAGFENPLTALAVSLAEFGENRDINSQGQSDVRDPNGINGREPSFGPWQIHLPSHPNVTQSCALDLTCSTQEAYRISKGGTDFGSWSAFTSGAFQRFMSEIADMIPATPSPSSDQGGPVGPVGPIGPAPTPKPGGGGGGFVPNLPLPTLPRLSKPGVPTLGEQGGPNPLSGLPNPLTGMDAIGKFFADVENNTYRIAFVVLGGLMVFFGARLYFHQDVGSEQVAA